MKILITTIVAICCVFSTWSQNQLKNTFSYYSEVYGGMEDGGVSRTESYVFVASSRIELKGLAYNGVLIVLEKNDSLVVNVHLYTPYTKEILDSSDRHDELKEPLVKDRFEVMKDGRVYYANVKWPYKWPGTIEYVYKKNTFTAVKKEGFDTGYTGYAP